MLSPVRLILMALALRLIGVVLPFMMVMEYLESTLALNFLSQVCSTAGLIIGFVGIAQYVGSQRK